MNPNRVCKMCQMAGFEQRPIADLIAAAEKIPIPKWDGNNKISQEERDLRDLANNCPACLLATIRQQKGWTFGFNWKEEAKNWMNKYFQKYEAR
jgi:hypothetical protein